MVLVLDVRVTSAVRLSSNKQAIDASDLRELICWRALAVFAETEEESTNVVTAAFQPYLAGVVILLGLSPPQLWLQDWDDS